MPAAWPDPDESVMITGHYLTDPIVTNALAYVEQVANASVLAIQPSTYILVSWSAAAKAKVQASVSDQVFVLLSFRPLRTTLTPQLRATGHTICARGRPQVIGETLISSLVRTITNGVLTMVIDTA
jgi:hypothetical protein